MPISRKRFSKKRVKKSIKKNTRKHKKRTLRRKHKKSGKRVRFFGGFGEDEDCAICDQTLKVGEIFETNCHHNFHRACIEQWCNGKAVCPCPICRTSLDPNPNPNPVVAPPPPVIHDYCALYRVEFFTFINNPQTGEIDRIPVSVNNISDSDISILIDYFIGRIPLTEDENYLFLGDPHESNPHGYIELYEHQPDVVINEGDMDIHTIPPTIVQSVTITKVPNFEA